MFSEQLIYLLTIASLRIDRYAFKAIRQRLKRSTRSLPTYKIGNNPIAILQTEKPGGGQTCVKEVSAAATHKHSHSIHKGQSTFAFPVILGEDVFEKSRMEASFLIKDVGITAVFRSVEENDRVWVA